MYELIIKKIKKGLFCEAAREIKSLTNDEIENILVLSLGVGSDITSYAFANYLILDKTYSFFAQKICYNLCDSLFNYLFGAIYSTYAHVSCMIELRPDDFSILELQAYLYEIPDEVFTPVEMYHIAKNLLSINPKSAESKYCFNRTKEYSSEPLEFPWDGLFGIEKTKILIEKGRFSKALANLASHSREELFTLLRIFARDGFLYAYSFVWAMIREEEKVDLHLLAAEFFLDQYVPFLAKGYYGREGVAFFHTHRAVELEPENVEIIEQLLEIYELTPESFEPEEAKVFVEKVLAQKPESKAALHVLGELS
ncbi:hypothetical protein FJ366_02925 [Candidatus Dependentiae bacterium]|nr:hypothetical protein [Candidatus Dependentiae bacterium]